MDDVIVAYGQNAEPLRPEQWKRSWSAGGLLLVCVP
jgi:hypothetical protein